MCTRYQEANTIRRPLRTRIYANESLYIYNILVEMV